jgi:hypothetical protein
MMTVKMWLRAFSGLGGNFGAHDPSGKTAGFDAPSTDETISLCGDAPFL